MKQKQKSGILRMLRFSSMFQCILLFFLFYPFISASGQEKITTPALTKAQLYEDYDYFVQMVADINPQLPIRKKLSGIDILQRLRAMRNSIENCTEPEFYLLLKYAIDACNDGHSDMLGVNALRHDSKEYVKANGVEPLTDEMIEEAAIAAEKAQQVYDSVYNKVKLWLPIKYFDGAYYAINTFRLRGTTYPTGLRLTAINGKEAKGYIHSELIYARRSWDYKNSRYYSNSFELDPQLLKKDSIKLSFADKQNNTHRLSLSYTDTLSYPQGKLVRRRTDDMPSIYYLKEQQIVYCRVPSMDYSLLNFYGDSLKKIAAGNKVQHLVVDIRDNFGGHDDVGLNIIRAAIKDTIKTDVAIYAMASERIKRKFLGNKEAIFDTVPFLNNAIFLVVEKEPCHIAPDSNSIKLEGKIFILQNEYVFSAAGTLAAVAGYSNKVINIGSRTGNFLGKGTNPLVFQLPHSKLMFRMEPWVDFSGAKNAADVMHDQVELERNLSFEEWIFRKRYKGDVYAPDYLISHDPVFKKALRD
jgi:hypothetical protein